MDNDLTDDPEGAAPTYEATPNVGEGKGGLFSTRRIVNGDGVDIHVVIPEYPTDDDYKFWIKRGADPMTITFDEDDKHVVASPHPVTIEKGDFYGEIKLNRSAEVGKSYCFKAVRDGNEYFGASGGGCQKVSRKAEGAEAPPRRPRIIVTNSYPFLPYEDEGS